MSILADQDLLEKVCDLGTAVAALGSRRWPRYSASTTSSGVGRHLRDALSGPLMVANERIHATDAGLLLIAKAV